MTPEQFNTLLNCLAGMHKTLTVMLCLMAATTGILLTISAELARQA